MALFEGNTAKHLAGRENELTPEEVVDFTHWPVTGMTPPKWRDESMDFYQQEVKLRGERYALLRCLASRVKHRANRQDVNELT